MFDEHTDSLEQRIYWLEGKVEELERIVENLCKAHDQHVASTYDARLSTMKFGGRS